MFHYQRISKVQKGLLSKNIEIREYEYYQYNEDVHHREKKKISDDNVAVGSGHILVSLPILGFYSNCSWNYMNGNKVHEHGHKLTISEV